VSRRAMFLEQRLVLAIELVAMPVTLADLRLRIGGARKTILGEQALIRAQTHRPAQLIHRPSARATCK